MARVFKMKASFNESTRGLLVIFALIFSILVFQSIVGSKGGKNTHDQVVRIIDGDTLVINASKVRLHGVDAPELGQECTNGSLTFDCGEASKNALSRFVLDSRIECEDKGSDKWGRMIGICHVDGKDLGELMVSSGWAIAYRRYSDAYVASEDFARENDLGMWSGEFMSPSDWRASK